MHVTWLLRPSPLHRGIDVFQAWLMVTVGAITLTGAALVAALAARPVWHQAHETRIDRHPAQAVLVGNPVVSVVAGIDAQARVSWSTPDGRSRSGLVPVAPSAVKGTSTTVWLDRNGNPVDAPTNRTAAAAEAALAASASSAVVALCAVAGWRVLSGRLDRLRYTRWDADWRRFGPRWSTGTPD